MWVSQLHFNKIGIGTRHTWWWSICKKYIKSNQMYTVVSGIFCIENGHISWDLPGLASGDMIYHKFSLWVTFVSWLCMTIISNPNPHHLQRLVHDWNTFATNTFIRCIIKRYLQQDVIVVDNETTILAHRTSIIIPIKHSIQLNEQWKISR